MFLNFRNFVTSFIWKRERGPTFEQIVNSRPPRCFVPRFVEIFSVVVEKKMKVENESLETHD